MEENLYRLVQNNSKLGKDKIIREAPLKHTITNQAYQQPKF